MKFDELKQRFTQSEYKCLIVRDGEEVFSSTARGIFPLVQAIPKMKGAYLADRIIGRAAALLCVHGGVLAVYADVMTESATNVFAEYGILFEFGKLTDKILNRDQSGLCPFELLAQKTTCPKQMLGRVALQLQEFGMELPNDLELGCGGGESCCKNKND